MCLCVCVRVRARVSLSPDPEPLCGGGGGGGGEGGGCNIIWSHSTNFRIYIAQNCDREALGSPLDIPVYIYIYI